MFKIDGYFYMCSILYNQLMHINEHTGYRARVADDALDNTGYSYHRVCGIPTARWRCFHDSGA